MSEMPTLRAEERLAACSLHEIVRGVRSDTGDRVVVKRARLSHDPVAASEEVDRERRALQALAGLSGIPALRDGGPNEVVTRDLGGHDLAHGDVAGTLDLESFLTVAQRVARVVAGMHARGLLHLDLHPGNIVLRREDLAVEIIDLASTVPLPGAGTAAAIDPGAHRGRPAYRAPELSDAAVSLVDDRTDLYALGATLTFLATGAPPFPDDDPVVLRHAQRTSAPPPAHLLAPWLTEAVAAVLTRLLQPDPDLRYRSAEGLAADLAELGGRIDRGAVTAGFRPGQRDLTRAPRTPRGLVGRAREVAALHDALAAARSGGSHGVFVTGPAGIGKTVLVDALRAHVTASGGRFVGGKFDELRRDQPFSAPAAALRELAAMLLAGEPAQVDTWHDRLLSATGADAALLAAAVPELRGVLRVEGDRALEDPLELRARLRAVLIDLLRAVAHREEPLVLFLDDLQWSDQPSLDLLGDLLQDARVDGLLIVGAYRDGEVAADHPLRTQLQHLDAAAASVQHVAVEPFARTEVEELLAIMLPQEAAVDPALLDAVVARTGGNPFHAVELVLHLHGAGTLRADHQRGRWLVAADRLADLGVGDELIPMLVDELDALVDPEGVLATAACLGSRCTLEGLSQLTDLGTHAIEEALAPAVRRGVLRAEPSVSSSSSPTGRAQQVLVFAHDRMFEAARALLTPAARRARHLELARRLGVTAEEPVDVLGAAEQLLLAAPVELAAGEAERAVEVLRRAGAQASATGAFATAVRFLELAVALTPEDAWTVARDRTYALHAALHSALHGAADHDRADEVFALLAAHAHGPAELAGEARLHITGLANRTRYEEAVLIGVELLGRLGIEVPLEDPLPDLARGLAVVDAAFSGAAGDVLPTAPAAAEERAVAWLLNRSIPAAFFWRPEVAFWMSVTGVERWLAQGYLDEYVYPAACLTLATIGLREDPDLGYRVATEALRIGAERAERAPTEIARTHHVVGLFVAHWFEPLERDIEHARLAFDQLARAGETDFACFSFFTSQAAVLDTATDLQVVAQEIATAGEYAARTGNTHAQHAYISFHRLLLALQGRTDTPGSFEGEGFREAAHLHATAGNPMARGFFHTYRAVTAAIFGDEIALRAHAAEANRHAAYLTGFWPTVLIRVVSALAASDQLGAAPADPAPDGEDRDRAAAQLADDHRWLVARGADSPVNIGHLAELVTAERAALDGELWAAQVAFERAIEQAAGHHRSWHLGVILERAARFHLRHGLERSGGDLLLRARRVWQQLGAPGKVAELDRQVPELVDVEAERSSGAGADVDHLALLRAVRAISGERTRPGLVERVVEVASQLSGATEVLLLARDREDEWWLEGGADRGRPVTRQRLAAASAAGAVPAGLPRGIRTAGDLLVSADASTDPRFSDDPRYAGGHPCSLAILPVRHQGTLEAVLVLETRTRRSAFGSARLELLTMLAAQLATALDSLRVHERLERTVEERTEALEAANARLDVLNRTDALTGIANRRQFDEVLAVEWRRARRRGAPVGLILLDVDRFKAFNDRFGHQVGDTGLRAVAAALGSACRRASETVARFGGEEFAVVVADAAAESLVRLAEELRARVAELAIAGTDGVTISAGVALHVADGAGGDEHALLRAADRALYRAKQRGRDRVEAAWREDTTRT